MDAYEAWLRAMVDRYDGDGSNDMPGLKTRVAAWEIGNEHDGGCQGNLDDPELYVDLLATTYEIIKDEDPGSLVINGGAIALKGTSQEHGDYWRDFFALGGGEYTDAFNFHYNRERNGISQPELWLENLDYANELMDTYLGYRLPMWVTEFGTFSGTVEVPHKGEITQTEEEQSAWYFRTSVIGFDAGLEKVFVDLYGGDDSKIGSSSLYSDQRYESRLLLTTLRTISEYLDGFTEVEKLAEGQYRFTARGDDVYALWEGSVPSELGGTVTVVEIDGSSSTMNASGISFDTDAPVLVTP